MNERKSPNSSRGDFQPIEVNVSHVNVEGFIRGGTPSWKGDETGPVSLERFLARYGNSLFWLRVEGKSMEGAGLYPGDFVVISPSVEPRFGDLVAVRVGNDDLIVKRYVQRGLVSEFINRRVREKFDAPTEIIGTVVWHLSDIYARRKE